MNGRIRAGAWNAFEVDSEESLWLDGGPVESGQWVDVALVFDVAAPDPSQRMRLLVDGGSWLPVSIRFCGRRLRLPGWGCPIAFHLHALEPFTIDGQSATLPGKLGITADWAESITQFEDLINHNFQPVIHLVIKSAPLEEGQLHTQFQIL